MKATVIKRLNKRNFPSAEGNVPLPNPLEPGDIIDIVEEVKGTPYGIPANDRWFKTDRGYFVWSGGTTFNMRADNIVTSIVPKTLIKNFQAEIDLRKKNGNLNYNELSRISESFKTGDNVAIAIFDVGISKSHQVLRSKFKTFESPRDLASPHGTQLAALACSSTSPLFTGISPDAILVDCQVFEKPGPSKERFNKAKETLFELKKSGLFKGIIANISYDFRTDLDFLTEFFEALSREIIVVASAGEAHIGTNELAAEKTLQFPSRLENVIAVGSIDQNFPMNGLLNFNTKLNYLLPNFSYWSPTNKTDDDFDFISNDSAAAAIVSAQISNLISSGILGNFPSSGEVVSQLNEFAPQIKANSDLTAFNIFRP